MSGATSGPRARRARVHLYRRKKRKGDGRTEQPTGRAQRGGRAGATRGASVVLVVARADLEDLLEEDERQREGGDGRPVLPRERRELEDGGELRRVRTPTWRMERDADEEPPVGHGGVASSDDVSETAHSARSISIATSVDSATDDAASLPLAGSKASHARSKPASAASPCQVVHSAHRRTLVHGTPIWR